MGRSFKNIRKTFIMHPDSRERFLPMRQPGTVPLRQFGLQLGGVSELRTAYHVIRPNPDFSLLLFTLQGGARLTTTQGTRKLRAGDLLIAPARLPYAYEMDGKRWRIQWFHFNPRPPGLDLPFEDVRVQRAFYLDRLEGLMEGLLHEATREETQRTEAVRFYAELIGLYLKREVGASGHNITRRQKRLSDLWVKVNTQLAQPWSVGELARELHLSEVQCHRLCVRFHGRSPMRMVTRLRMQRAEELLRSTADPLKQIAVRVGYENPFAFSTAFKRHAGCSPRAYRAQSGM